MHRRRDRRKKRRTFTNFNIFLQPTYLNFSELDKCSTYVWQYLTTTILLKNYLETRNSCGKVLFSLPFRDLHNQTKFILLQKRSPQEKCLKTFTRMVCFARFLINKSKAIFNTFNCEKIIAF